MTESTSVNCPFKNGRTLKIYNIILQHLFTEFIILLQRWKHISGQKLKRIFMIFHILLKMLSSKFFRYEIILTLDRFY